MRKRVLARIFKVRIHWRKHINKLVSVALLRVSASVITRFRKRYHEIPLAETCVSLRKRTEKWSGSVVSAATET